MTNEQTIEFAIHLFGNGYNCAQSVAIAVFSRFGEKENIPRKMASGFGGGIAAEKEVCGAVSGSVMTLGWFIPDQNKKNAAVAAYLEAFNKQFANTRCCNLVEGTPLAERHALCEDFVRFSVKWCLEALS